MFKWIEPLFFELSCTQADRQTYTHTDTQITFIHTLACDITTSRIYLHGVNVNMCKLCLNVCLANLEVGSMSMYIRKYPPPKQVMS